MLPVDRLRPATVSLGCWNGDVSPAACAEGSSGRSFRNFYRSEARNLHRSGRPDLPVSAEPADSWRKQALKTPAKDLSDGARPCPTTGTARSSLGYHIFGDLRLTPTLGRVRQDPLCRDIPLTVQFHGDLRATASTVHQHELRAGNVIDQIGMIRDVGPTCGGVNAHRLSPKANRKPHFILESTEI